MENLEQNDPKVKLQASVMSCLLSKIKIYSKII